MPLADFAPVTREVAAARAAGDVASGSVGDSGAFAPARSPAPVTAPGRLPDSLFHRASLHPGKALPRHPAFAFEAAFPTPPDKNMHGRCTTVPCTASREPQGFAKLPRTRARRAIPAASAGAVACASSRRSWRRAAQRWRLSADAVRSPHRAPRLRHTAPRWAGGACAPLNGFHRKEALDYRERSRKRRSTMAGDGSEEACDTSTSARTPPSRPSYAIHFPLVNSLPG